jgi:cell division protease FtsH
MMVTKRGMSEKLGPLAYRSSAERAAAGFFDGEGRLYGEDTARLIDAEVKDLLEDARARALAILRDRSLTLDAIHRGARRARDAPPRGPRAPRSRRVSP